MNMGEFLKTDNFKKLSDDEKSNLLIVQHRIDKTTIKHAKWLKKETYDEISCALQEANELAKLHGFKEIEIQPWKD